MNDILHTYAQVEKIIPIHRALNLPTFSDISLTELDIWKQMSNIQKITSQIPEIKLNTDVEKIKNTQDELSKQKKAYKRILTSPAVYASIQVYKKNKAVRIIALPFIDNIISVPKKGEWIHIIGLKLDLLNMQNIKSYENEYLYYYIPTQLFKKLNTGIIPSYTDLEEKELGNDVKSVLWPREGSSFIQNKNGKSYFQLDNNEFLLSTGFSDFNIKNNDILSSRHHEYIRYNPITQNDNIIFSSYYDKEWEERVFNYTKQLNELSGDSEELVDSNIKKIKELKNFESRIKLFFGIDFSSNPEFEYAEPQGNNQDELTKDSGTLIHSKKIYLSTTSPNKKQTKYTIARSERTIDLLSGLIDYIKDMHKIVIDTNKSVNDVINSLATHTHLYTSTVAVLTPDPSTSSKLTSSQAKITKINQNIDKLNSSLTELQSKLDSISTKNIFIP